MCVPLASTICQRIHEYTQTKQWNVKTQYFQRVEKKNIRKNTHTLNTFKRTETKILRVVLKLFSIFFPCSLVGFGRTACLRDLCVTVCECVSVLVAYFGSIQRMLFGRMSSKSHNFGREIIIYLLF